MAEFEPDLAVDSESSETFDSELDSEVDSLSFHALDDISEPPLSNLFHPLLLYLPVLLLRLSMSRIHDISMLSLEL